MKKIRASLQVLLASLLFGAVTALSSAQVAPSSTATSGPVGHGVAIALSTKSSTVALGTPITITIELKNVSGRLLVLQTPQVASGYAYWVVDLASNTVVQPRNPPRSGDDIYGGLNMHIGAGESYTLKVRLDDMVRLERPGRYRVTVSTQFVLNRETMKDVAATSNSIVLHIVR